MAVRLSFLFLAFTSFLCTSGRAQETPETFAALSDSMGVRLDELLPDYFLPQDNEANDYLDAHLTLYARAEKLEMRFHLRPEQAGDPLAKRPQLRVHTLAMNLGSNDEDAVTSVHSFGEEELNALNADWARMYTFRPKRSFSERQHAQLIAAYRAGRGLVYTILLFDRAPGSVEDRQLTLRF